MAGFLNSIRLFFSNKKLIKTQRAGDLLSYKTFALKSLKSLKIEGAICNKDLKFIADLIKEHKNIVNVDLENAFDIFEIPNNMFQHCESLETIILPKTIQRIGDSAFESCINLKHVLMPDGLRFIGKSSFYGCESIKEIDIPSGVEKIGGWSFVCDSLEQIKVVDGNRFFSSSDGILYSIDKTILVKYPTKKEKQDISIISGVVEIVDGAFMNCSHIKNVSFPSSLKIIGDNAFMNTNICDLVFPDGLKKIGKMSFMHCPNIVEFTIPFSVDFVGERAFSNCNKLAKVHIEDGVCGIEDNIFLNSHSLIEAELPQSAMRNKMSYN